MPKSFVPLRADHRGHYKAGWLISLGIAVVASLMTRTEIVVILVLLGTLAGAWAKEFFHDKLAGRGTPEYSDAWITAAPSILVALAILIYAEIMRFL